MSDINWGEAPEGATHYVVAKDLLRMSEFVIAGVKDSYHAYDSFGNGGWSSNIDDDNRFTVTPKPEAKPTYTQAMVDAGELPSVGMLVNHQGVDKIIMLPMDANNVFTLKSVKLGLYSFGVLDNLVAIDTRTDEEKAADDFVENRQYTAIDDELVKAIYLAGTNWSKS